MATGPGYTVPTAPPVKGGSMPFIGPYQDQFLQAQKLWQDTQNQLNTQKGTTMLNYGFQPDGHGGMQMGTDQPYGQLQLMNDAQRGQDTQMDQSLMARGVNGGLAAQQHQQLDFAQGGERNSLLQSLAAAMAQNDAQRSQGQDQFGMTKAQIERQSAQYAIKNGLFNPHAHRLQQGQVDHRVKALAAAYKAKYGGLKKDGKNGMNFQERLNLLAKNGKLYNPTAHYNVAGVRY